VEQELDRLRIPNFIFEKEGASDQAPGDRFRSAVRGASVYIGVFGKGLGKYTKEEYELARAHRIACHLYVQHLDDEDRSEELKVFLKSLNGVSDVPTIHYFQATDELATQIMPDLMMWIDQLVDPVNLKKDRIDTKDNLPLLCNRADQDRTFQSHVRTYFETIPRRPLLLLLPGVHEEGHGYYLKRTEWKLLKEFLKVRPNKTGQNASQAAQSENDKDIHLKAL
jgi:hypothetical protein